MPVVRARLILGALLGFLILGLSPASYPLPRRAPASGAGDAALHLATIERLRAGERYYEAVGGELRARGYPATRVFNWRTPAHFELVAALSAVGARWLLGALALAAILLTPFALKREPAVVLVIATLCQLGAVAAAFFAPAVGMAEVWAGVLIALSACAYHRQLWIAGAAIGIGAVFIRELAAPYALACGLAALSGRRRREFEVWAAGFLAYGLYFAVHAGQVAAHQLPGDLQQQTAWLRWNGLAFILATVKVSGALVSKPHALTALYAAGALAGATSPRVPRQISGPLLTYVLLFAVAGQPFNYYWGFVTAPIWAFAAAHAVEGLPRLIASALPRRDRSVPPIVVPLAGNKPGTEGGVL